LALWSCHLGCELGTLTIAPWCGITILQVITIPAMGLSMACFYSCGQNIGAGNIKRAARVTVLGSVWGLRF